MAYPIVRIDPTTAGRELSPALWRGALEKYDFDPSLGTLRKDDWTRPRTQAIDTVVEGWWLSEEGTAGATSESFDTNTGPDGEVLLDAAAAADFVGIRAHAGASATLTENIALPTHTTAASQRGDVIFEARVFLDITLNDTMFVGLAEGQSTVLTGDNTLTLAGDYIGFYRLDNGDLAFVSRDDVNGGTAVVHTTNIVALADLATAAWTKLGFRVNADSTVEVFVDGAKVRTTSDSGNAVLSILSTALPSENLSRTLIAARGVTLDNDPIGMRCEFIYCYVAE